jgi:RNA polymerase sigma factor (sigma-70 family)
MSVAVAERMRRFDAFLASSMERNLSLPFSHEAIHAYPWPQMRGCFFLQYLPPRFVLKTGGAAGMTPMLEQDLKIVDIVARERSRLHGYIRRRAPVGADVEDLLQEVFYELVRANRLFMPIDYVTGWLYRVARNRITDLFRKRQVENAADATREDEDGELLRIEDLLPSPEAGPEELFLRGVLLEELQAALGELPAEQREVFLAHEVEGRSFKEMAAESGVNLNTLLARKRYAVLFLRQRLQTTYREFLKK